jgi:aminodeoxyfutalosine synthase
MPRPSFRRLQTRQITSASSRRSIQCSRGLAPGAPGGSGELRKNPPLLSVWPSAGRSCVEKVSRRAYAAGVHSHFPAARLLPGDLRPLYEKVVAGGRVGEEEALLLFRHPDLNALGTIANVLRERKNGNFATYIRNLYVNYSNVCILSCQFCAFGAKKRDVHAFELSIAEMSQKVRAGLAQGITEVHMVGGLHPTLPAGWYVELLQTLRSLDPNLFLKAFTAIEIRHLAERIFKKTVPETLEILRSAGLGAITGGGAEIFDPGVRDRICRGKETAEEWLEVHETWHRMGMRSTATMLFGHVETIEQRVDHLRRLRELQDRTGGFTAFIPFAFVPETTAMAHIRPASAVEELRTLAVSRIYLDNFDHITAYWISFGLPLAALALNYGVDDLHGTIMEEKIFHMAGAKTPKGQTQAAFEKAIREAGRIPVARDTWYRRLEPGAAPTVNPVSVPGVPA